jgi:hypothetical protein
MQHIGEKGDGPSRNRTAALPGKVCGEVNATLPSEGPEFRSGVDVVARVQLRVSGHGLAAQLPKGIISAAYLIDALDLQWKDDPGRRAFNEFLAKDFLEGNRADDRVMTGFNVAQTLVQVLEQRGDWPKNPSSR